MNVEQPQTIECPGRIPASGRDGRDWGLEIADWNSPMGDLGSSPALCAKQTQFSAFLT
jgi:hypothetical protein